MSCGRVDVATGRVADERRAVADDKRDLMAQILELRAACAAAQHDQDG